MFMLFRVEGSIHVFRKVAEVCCCVLAWLLGPGYIILGNPKITTSDTEGLELLAGVLLTCLNGKRPPFRMISACPPQEPPPPEVPFNGALMVLTSGY